MTSRREIIENNDEMIKEAQDAIKAVNAQYGYTPGHLSFGELTGACMTSVDDIVSQISDDVKAKLWSSPKT